MRQSHVAAYSYCTMRVYNEQLPFAYERLQTPWKWHKLSYVVRSRIQRIFSIWFCLWHRPVYQNRRYTNTVEGTQSHLGELHILSHFNGQIISFVLCCLDATSAPRRVKLCGSPVLNIATGYILTGDAPPQLSVSLLGDDGDHTLIALLIFSLAERSYFIVPHCGCKCYGHK